MAAASARNSFTSISEVLYLQLGDEELEERAEIGFFLKIESRARGIIQCR